MAIPMYGKTFNLQSPNKRLQVTVVSGEALTWSILHDSKEVMHQSQIDINNAYQGKASASAVKNNKISFATPFYRQKSVTTEYNELTLSLGKGWSVVFRAFDEGVAYRFQCKGKVPAIISDEKAEFHFNGDCQSWLSFTTNDKKPEAMAKYKSMGVKGFKIDFLDRDDQEAVELAYRIAEAALKYQMVLDYHGYYKPTGWKTYDALRHQ